MATPSGSARRSRCYATVIAVDTARLADPHVRMGLSAGDGGALIWPQLIGFAKAKHYVLTGEPIGAVEAERIGPITFVLAADTCDAQTAIRYTKSTANLALRDLFNNVYEAGGRLMRDCAAKPQISRKR